MKPRAIIQGIKCDNEKCDVVFSLLIAKEDTMNKE